MAPFLTAGTDQEPAKPVQHTKRSLKPVVPAIPRLYERRPPNSLTTTLPSSNHLVEQVVDSTAALKDSPPDSPLSIRTEHNAEPIQDNSSTPITNLHDRTQVGGVTEERGRLHIHSE